jgi:hypothetical protein
MPLSCYNEGAFCVLCVLLNGKQEINMTYTVDPVALVMRALGDAMATGDRCTGTLYNKTSHEWRGIFNAVSQKTGIPVIHIKPLASDSDAAISNRLGKLVSAFEQAANAPVIILVNTSGDELIAHYGKRQAIDKFIEYQSSRFPKAVFTRIVDKDMDTDSDDYRPSATFRSQPSDTPKPHGGPALA